MQGIGELTWRVGMAEIMGLCRRHRRLAKSCQCIPDTHLELAEEARGLRSHCTKQILGRFENRRSVEGVAREK